MNLQTTKKLNNGVEIPMLGLGVFRMEGDDTANVVRWAIETGYTHIDTAKVYGNEVQVGEGIRQSGIAREKLFVTTKLWNEDTRQGKIREGFEGSLASLGLDYIDLYLIHWPADGFEKAWEEMSRIYQEGRVRAIGVSNFHPHHLERIAKVSEIVPAVNQFEMHPYLTQQPLREYCGKQGIASESWSPLGGARGNVLADPVLAEIGQAYGKSPAQVILRWNLQSGVVVIPKTTHKERLIQNASIYDFELSKQDIARIDAMNKNQRFGSDPDNFNF